MKVTSLSDSKSLLFPTITMTILGLARVRASVNQFVSALYVSRLVKRWRKGKEREENSRERERGRWGDGEKVR